MAKQSALRRFVSKHSATRFNIGFAQSTLQLNEPKI